MMTPKKTAGKNSENIENRRSGLDRRWIIAPHSGKERRSGADRRSGMLEGGALMATDTETSELATFKDLLMANSLQVDAVAQLLIDKGVFTKEEFFDMLKRVQTEYEKKGELES